MPKYHLFEVFGIELEYMLVHQDSFRVASIVDKLLTTKNGGELTSDIENANIAWSNELVGHVVELKTNGPTSDLTNLANDFHKNVLEINNLLDSYGAKLLPTASHPLMNPLTDTELWKHSYSEVYELYNRIFNCKGHGWSNVQSTHINLPFYDDAEFEKLHAAIRLILPLIPGLCASSPILEGKITGFKDTRLEFYRKNQQKIPVITGKVIPEPVFSKEAYHQQIFEPIKQAIQPYDTEKVLDHHFLNSRGAIARFDRNAIEIRLVDIQECPKADIAICTFIIEVLKMLVNEELSTLAEQKSLSTDQLHGLLLDGIKNAEKAVVGDLDYLALFGVDEAMSQQKLWQSLFRLVKARLVSEHQETIDLILQEGTLSSRIMKALGVSPHKDEIVAVYHRLADCLNKNELFVP